MENTREHPSPIIHTLTALAGPVLRGYLMDPTVLEIMCNDNGTTFLTRFGVGTVEVEHPGFGVLDTFLRGVAHAIGAEWRDSSPRLAAALEGAGWRIQAGRPPLTPAIFLALRKHPAHVFPLEDFVRKGILTQEQRDILATGLAAKQRLVIAGGVGSAKTSLLNALLDTLRDSPQRVVLCEDAPEVQLTMRNCAHMRVVPGVSTLRDLVQDCLRLNPDIIVVGEVRGAETLDALKAGQTGHGLLLTLHVDAVQHTMARLEQLVQEVSASPQRDLIGEVIDLVVHMAKHGTSWRCTGILAVDGYTEGHYHTRRLA